MPLLAFGKNYAMGDKNHIIFMGEMNVDDRKIFWMPKGKIVD